MRRTVKVEKWTVGEVLAGHGEALVITMRRNERQRIGRKRTWKGGVCR